MISLATFQVIFWIDFHTYAFIERNYITGVSECQHSWADNHWVDGLGCSGINRGTNLLDQPTEQIFSLLKKLVAIDGTLSLSTQYFSILLAAPLAVTGHCNKEEVSISDDLICLISNWHTMA